VISPRPLTPDLRCPAVERLPVERLPAQQEAHSVDPTLVPGWDQWLAAFPDATPFHTAAWAAVLKRAYGHVPLYLVRHAVGAGEQRVESEERRGLRGLSTINRAPRISTPSPVSNPLSVLPLMELRSVLTGRRGVSLPFSDLCPQIGTGGSDAESADTSFPDGSSHHLPQSRIFALARSRHWRFFELRGGRPPTADAVPSQVFYRHTLHLTDDLDGLFHRCDPATRRAVRKAGQTRLEIGLGHTLGALHEFYSLHVQTRRKHGLPPQPFAFFLALYDEIISRGQGFITVARRDLRPVAAAVFLHFGKRAVFKFGASDESLLELRGNNLVMWDSICWLAEHGFDTLDFGRTALSQEGLRRFKLGWGTCEQPLHYYRYCLRANAFVRTPNQVQGWHNALFARLPLPINRLIGSLLYRYMA
jgi:hypothetical protein